MKSWLLHLNAGRSSPDTDGARVINIAYDSDSRVQHFELITDLEKKLDRDSYGNLFARESRLRRQPNAGGGDCFYISVAQALEPEAYPSARSEEWRNESDSLRRQIYKTGFEELANPGSKIRDILVSASQALENELS